MSDAAEPITPPPVPAPVPGRARLTMALVVLAFLASSLLALGVGRPPRAENAGVVALREETGAFRLHGKLLNYITN